MKEEKKERKFRQLTEQPWVCVNRYWMEDIELENQHWTTLLYFITKITKYADYYSNGRIIIRNVEHRRLIAEQIGITSAQMSWRLSDCTKGYLLIRNGFNDYSLNKDNVRVLSTIRFPGDIAIAEIRSADIRLKRQKRWVEEGY